MEHYVISSGLREIIEGSGIAQEFREIYACEFYYNENGDACWPKLDVNFTNKTQFVYRINKGILDVSRDKELNDSMPDDSKRVPFTNMIYMGDGLSDVPCMKMMRAYGGQAIAVYQASNRQGVEKLLADGRVDFIFPADYREGMELDRTVRDILRKMTITDRLLEGSDTLYESLVIMGGGVIGVEFATFYANLGCRVTLIEGMDRLLPTMDRELGQNLGQILKKQGVEVLTSAMVQSVEQAPQGLTVHIDQKGKEKAVSGEKVLCAIGRRPCWDGLFAPDLTPETRGRSLRVDEDFQTSIPGVYAIGDVSAVIQLAHVAAAQGIACVDRLCGAASATDLNVVPSCIYSSPEIAVVGLTEAEAKEQGINAVSGKCTMFGNARTVIEDPGRCFMKLVADRDTGRLIGAQLMCQHASDIISQLSAALVNGLTVRQLLAVMRPHPSFEEAMTEALERLAEKL